MYAAGSSNGNIGNGRHWTDSIDELPDSDASDTDDEDERNFEGIRFELENLLVRMAMIVEECYHHFMHPSVRVCIPQRTSKLTGAMWVHWVLTNPNPTTCYEQFRMLPKTFLKLCNTLKHNGFLQSSRYVKITEQVAAFCLVMAQCHTQRTVADRLQRSLHTVSVYVNRTAKALCRLGKNIIRPAAMELPHPYVARNGRYYPWFAKCIGAIDGTHVKACVQGENIVPYRSRKSTITQNVMCVVDFDLCFTYVYAGWEGNTHDSRIFQECIEDPTALFPMPVEDYFYLVDSAYGCYKGFLPPHRNERYHLEDFRRGRRRLKNAAELFNYRHSSLRSAVERTFGVWKARFPIFDNMHPYPIENQRLFVVACCAVHNFIRKDCGADDPLFCDALTTHYGQHWIDVSQLPTMTPVPYVAHGAPPDRTRESKEMMIIVREAMTSHMWETANEE
ncbi:uncharacterized protein LOC132162972 [Corylus avellana]|uniref:uncharacterized protein LOC132162972 n=1 Tax=Corylus avellana TaxID=13451 RepID=UPI00286D6932|nr:uncharacterized protein LOC132162972 [Corylus avellana]